MNIPTLIVDDHADIRLLLRILIDEANDGLFVVGEAESGPDALDQIDAQDPSVIVLDEMMPDMSGLETAERIFARRPSQVVILCSAYLDEEVIARAEKAGVRACVSKDEVRRLPGMIREAVGAGS